MSLQIAQANFTVAMGLHAFYGVNLGQNIWEISAVAIGSLYVTEFALAESGCQTYRFMRAAWSFHDDWEFHQTCMTIGQVSVLVTAT